MEIPKWPYDEREQSKIKLVEITDPGLVAFIEEIGFLDKNHKDAKLHQLFLAVRNNITEYSREYVLQVASILLQASNTMNLQAGSIMEQFRDQEVETLQSDTSEKTSKIA